MRHRLFCIHVHGLGNARKSKGKEKKDVNTAQAGFPLRVSRVKIIRDGVSAPRVGVLSDVVPFACRVCVQHCSAGAP